MKEEQIKQSLISFLQDCEAVDPGYFKKYNICIKDIINWLKDKPAPVKEEKKQYNYLLATYQEKIDGEEKWADLAILCKTDKSTPAGIPTKGYLVEQARGAALQYGAEYIEGSLHILNIIKLTKSQYEALNYLN